MTDKIIVLSTCPSREEAERIGKAIVEARLAACVNLVDGIHSIYLWKGEMEQNTEVLLVIKTRRELFNALRERLSQMHTYEVPEVLAVPVIDGSPAYLDWIDREVAPPENK